MKIRNLSADSLVAGEVAAAPELYEWKSPSVGADGVFDASACSHSLMVRCSNCGMQMDEPSDGGVLECPDCGEEDFDVQQLFERAVVEVTGVEFEVTGKGSQRFLHISIPSEWKKAKAFYTLDGSEPNPKCTMYRHPFSIERKAYVVKLVLYTDEEKSSLISYFVPPVDGYRYSCPICTTQIISASSAAQCPTCGFIRTFLTDGTCTDTPVGILCPLCNTEFTTTASPAQCPKCGSGYEYIVGGDGWTYKGHSQLCPACRRTFNYRVGVREHCPRCGAHVVYCNNSWAVKGAPARLDGGATPLPPRRRSASVPTYNPRRKVTWSTNSDSLGALILSLLAAIIIILLRILQ